MILGHWGYTGGGVKVCIIDSGIDKDHFDLPEVAGEHCYCSDNCCPDGTSEDTNATDEFGHGTRTAGVIASQDDTDKGIAYDSDLYVVRVTDEDGESTITDIGDAIDWCRNQGVDIVSMSLREGPYTSEECPSSIDIDLYYAYVAGITLVAASGNDAKNDMIGYPACSPLTISVGATYDGGDGSTEVDWCEGTGGYWFGEVCYEGVFQEKDFGCIDYPLEDTVACWSNIDTDLDLVAPGFEITTTSLGGGFTSSYAGTSLSAPMVSGAVALLLEANSSLQQEDIKDLLYDTGDWVINPDWEGGGPLFKRIDIEAALNEMCDKDNDGHYNEACSGGDDCDDADGSTYSGAIEYCDGVDNDCDDVIDEACLGSEPEGESYNCSEAGYEQCAGYTYGDCNVELAINDYSVSSVQWGEVNDSSDPYVIGSYSFGWKLAEGEDTYYDVDNPGPAGEDDCNYEDQCAGDEVSDESTMVTTYAPGIVSRKNILGYDKTASYACWTWFNPFSPNYGGSNPIYVLNCYDNGDCSSGYFCDKSGNWEDWDCVPKKGDGQNCSFASECSSGYCDNDGLGLNDDGVCFTPYETYFDGNEIKYCEYSTGYGDINCDEKEIGNGCNSSCEYSSNTPTNSTMFYPNGGESFSEDFATINWTSSSDLDNDFVRYFLQYSNDSGANWFNIISDYGYENKLNDSSTSKLLTFDGNEDKTIYVRIPKNAKVSHASFDLTGLPR